MCFKTRNLPVKKTAQYAISVYKIVTPVNDTEVYTYFRNYTYKLYERQPVVCLNVEKDILGYYKIEQGYHSYKKMPFYGKHYSGIQVCRFVIPKGSTYYENAETIVSDQLVLAEI